MGRDESGYAVGVITRWALVVEPGRNDYDSSLDDIDYWEYFVQDRSDCDNFHDVLDYWDYFDYCFAVDYVRFDFWIVEFGSVPSFVSVLRFSLSL